uniref:protein C1orf194 homolog n=1 Tax=Scatophagus argus TaxID=75038 RepID=UPI001ED7CCA9|nr:protein C1orf194 homolog [Scatophagus argus]
MSRRDPLPTPRPENDFTLSGFRPQQRKTYDKPTHIAQTEEPWSHLHDTATAASSWRSVMHSKHQAPCDNLDLKLNAVYDHHKDCFRAKNQILYQKETVSEDQRKQEMQDMLENEQDIRKWVDPQRRSIHSIK